MTRSQQAIRATAIKAGKLSMLHMHHVMTTVRPDTPAMRWGRLVHMAVLDPLALARLPRWEGYATRDGDTSYAKRGAAWNEFAASVESGDWVGDDDLDALRAIIQAAKAPLAKLPRIVETERQIDWTDDSYGPATARLDAILDGGTILELKTTSTLDTRRFLSSAAGLCYHLQMGWYLHGAVAALTEVPRDVVMLAIESRPPHAWALYDVPLPLLETSYMDAADIASRYRACEAVGVYPGPYDSERVEYTLPLWYGIDGVKSHGDWILGDDEEARG